MLSKSNPKYISNEISIKGIGQRFIEAKIPSSKQQKDSIYELYEMGIDIRLVQAMPKYKIYTKLIQINPKYVIINNCDYDLDISQGDDYSNCVFLSK